MEAPSYSDTAPNVNDGQKKEQSKALESSGTLQHSDSSSTVPETTVLIVGGGPIGLISGIMLARFGIRSTIVERHAKRLDQPKASAVNPRSLEILKQLGLDTDHLRRLGALPADVDMVRFATSMTGLEFGSIPYERQNPDAKDITPEPLFNIAQPTLEEYLSERAQETDAITMLREVNWQNSEKVDNGFEKSHLLDKKRNASISIRSKYLLACDGANARSREQLKIPMSTLDGWPLVHTHYVSVHFQADLTQMKSGILWFIIDVDKNGAFICYERDRSWVFVLNFDPTQTPPSTFTEQYCRSIIDESIGKKTQYEILSVTIWSTCPRIADFYRSQTHSLAFLVGDAAHAFPPTGGLGINTGIADAHNITWKIYAAENKWFGDVNKLLDSYGEERRPVAIANSRQSYLNQQKMGKLGNAILGDDTRGPTQRMEDAVSRKAIKAAILENKEHFDSINLQIGYVYGKSDAPTRSCSVYIPECVPGARLPHGWIQVNGLTTSTLDLIDGFTFVLLATPGFSPEHQSPLYKYLDIVPVKLLRLGIGFNDPDGKWKALAGLEKGQSGILLRPDQHIVATVHNMEEVDQALYKYLLR